MAAYLSRNFFNLNLQSIGGEAATSGANTTNDTGVLAGRGILPG